KPAWPSAAKASGFAFSPDGTHVAFVVDQDLLVHTLATATDHKVAHAEGRISGVAWSADGANLTYTVGGTPGTPTQHDTIRPEIGNKIIFRTTEGGRGGGGGESFTVPAAGGTPTPAAAAGRGGGGGGGRGGGGRIDATHTLST